MLSSKDDTMMDYNIPLRVKTAATGTSNNTRHKRRISEQIQSSNSLRNPLQKYNFDKVEKENKLKNAMINKLESFFQAEIEKNERHFNTDKTIG